MSSSNSNSNDKSMQGNETSGDFTNVDRTQRALQPSSKRGAKDVKHPIHSSSAKRHKRTDSPTSTQSGKTNRDVRSASYSSSAEVTTGLATSDEDNFDLCTPEGQLAAAKASSPNGKTSMTWEQAKHAARREYNRVNAARARQRHKETAETRDQHIASLQAQVDQLTRVNQTLVNYICELQVAANTKAANNGNSPESLYATLTALAGSSKDKGISLRHEPVRCTENLSDMVSRLQQTAHSEEARHRNDSQNSTVISNLSQAMNDRTFSLDSLGLLNQLIRGQEIAGLSINPVAPSIQAQPVLPQSTTNGNSSYPWNGAATINQASPSNSQIKLLWDVLALLQGSNNAQPTSK